MMMAMLKLHRDERLAEMGWKVILQIHDEVILEGPEESHEEAMELLSARWSDRSRCRFE